jgi:hypothetical protein
MALLGTIIGRGATGAKPAAGTPGALYYDTTLGKWQRDNGSTWDDCEPTPGAEISASAYHNANVTISNTTWTYLALNSEYYDNGGLHDLVTNNGRLTAPVTGRYAISAAARFAASATGTRQLRVVVNRGNTVLQIGPIAGHATEATRMAVSGDVQLTAGDYIEMQVWQDSGGNLDCQYTVAYCPNLSMHLIR